jgi:hypothetical protein
MIYPIYTFSKRITGTSINEADLNDPGDIAKVNVILNNLDTLPGVKDSTLSAIRLRTNPKKWIRAILKAYPPDVKFPEIHNLLFNFTDSMKTRMREESKYALGLLLEGKLVLCHSVYGEETITPEWKIIPRMLDMDNVLRYVYFWSTGNDIYVRYWEKSATNSFVEWLGLPRKEAFEFGGKYRICAEIGRASIEVQLTEQEMEEWLKDHPELEEGKIEFDTPISWLNVSEVRVGRQGYQNTRDFIQDYKAERYGVPRYQREYTRVREDYLPLIVKYYDEKTRVVRIEGDEEVTVLLKTTPKFEIVFADGDIEIRGSYLEELGQRFINGEKLRVFHAGMGFRTPPLEIGNTQIYNDVNISDAAQQIVDYYNDTTLQDRSLDILLKVAALTLLEESNYQEPIKYVFESLSDEILRKMPLEGQLSKVEDAMLEYKSRDFLGGGNKEVITGLSGDLRKKMEDSRCKIYLIGVEDNGRLDPIPSSRLKSDRIGTIRKGVQDNLRHIKIYAFPAIRQQDSVLVVIAVRA